MDELISRDIFDELAAAGRISVSPDEAETLRAELNQQMAVIRQLESIPLETDVRPMIHGNPYPETIRCGLRGDIPASFDNTRGILAEAPKTQDGYIVSPDIVHRKIG